MARKVVLALAALVALASILGLGWYFIGAPQRARVAAAQSNADANTATATAQAARDALKITVDTQALHGRIDVMTKENTDAVLAATGATAPVNADLHNTGLRALCLYDAYSGSDACRGLLHADPEQPAQ